MTWLVLIYFCHILVLNFIMGTLLYYVYNIKLDVHPVKIFIRCVFFLDKKYLWYILNVVKSNPFIIFASVTSVLLFFHIIEMYGFMMNMELFKRTAWTLSRGFLLMSGLAWIISVSLKKQFSEKQ